METERSPPLPSIAQPGTVRIDVQGGILQRGNFKSALAAKVKASPPDVEFADFKTAREPRGDATSRRRSRHLHRFLRNDRTGTEGGVKVDHLNLVNSPSSLKDRPPVDIRPHLVARASFARWSLPGP